MIDRGTGTVEILGPVLLEEKRYIDKLEADYVEFSHQAKDLEAALKTSPEVGSLRLPSQE